MVFTPARDASRSDGFRDLLEASYNNNNIVHLSAGSTVPLLKNSVWLVVRGMVKLTAISMQGDELLLGLAGANEPFGDPLTQVDAYAAITMVDTDLLCVSCDAIARNPALAIGLLQAVGQRYRQSEALLALLGRARLLQTAPGCAWLPVRRTRDLRCPELRCTQVSKFPRCAALSSDPQRSASFRAVLSSDPQRSASFRAALR
jgi:CRP-like cAMP-binding protein